MSGRIAIVTDDPGWHGARLKRAFEARGFDAAYASLSDFRFELASGCAIAIPGFDGGLPAGVFVRGIAAGTLEQVVLRLDYLHALRESGVPVYNDARAIERSVDKAMTSFLLHRAGIPTPPTWACESQAQARAVLMREFAAGHEVVAKPLFGSQGRGLARLSAGMDAPPAESCGAVWYLQRFVPCAGDAYHDWRVFVIGGHAVAAMVRRGSGWINNVAQGAECEAHPADGALAAIAVAAADALGMDYAGVDVLRDRDGRLQVLEVNGIPAWKGLQGVSEIDLAQRLADDFVARRLVRPLEATG
jgi:tetrahydromethanopterin:alpha-L-glutamate ligase